MKKILLILSAVSMLVVPEAVASLSTDISTNMEILYEEEKDNYTEDQWNTAISIVSERLQEVINTDTDEEAYQRNCSTYNFYEE